MTLQSAIRRALAGLLLLAFWGCSFPRDSGVAESAEQSRQVRANRLARETSPYLLLHAHNPVDWYPWGPEAFEKARRENKPIFLSIGYSSCYWCHVMERQVFSNEEIARYMNEHFVNIKVDREERPDVDDIYMTALIIYSQLSGSPQGGGWPLSMFLTPAGKPIAGGTYFPPESEEGRIGFPDLMRKIVDLWENRRETVEQNADIVTDYVRRSMRPGLSLTPVRIEADLVAKAVQALKDSYDPQHGGVGFDPAHPEEAKFPVPAKLALLQFYAARGDQEADRILLHTLDRIAAGGIHDHLGGGFHRYSTDREWLVPHFEKMLYDNAQLADIYLEAYRRTQRPVYRETAEGIFRFVLRDMTDPRGGFYSALDAETEGVEGKYYVWSIEEIDETLTPKEADLFKLVYGFDGPKRFEHGYIVHLPKPLAEVAQELRTSREELAGRLDVIRGKMLAERLKRKAPLRDDKILTSWNGLMIRALAHGGAVLERDEYIHAAEKAALFILSEMRDSEGRLLRTYRAETAKLNAYLDDYAFLVDGLLALHEATGDEKWLTAARRLTDDQIEFFWDETGDGFFFTAHHHEELLARTKNAYDAVLPAGNSISVRNLLRIAQLSGEEKYRQRAQEVLELFAPRLKETPQSLTTMALAMAEFLQPKPAASDKPDAVSQAAPVERSANRLEPTSAERPAPQGERNSDEKKKKKDEFVAIKAYLSVDRLPAGGRCDVIVFVDIRDGWHINTNPAQPDYFVPTKLAIKSKLGAQLKHIRYPKGKALRIPGLDEPQLVYEKRIAIRGTIEIPATAAGQTDEMEIELAYQACNEQACLRPAKASLKGRIAVARVGEPVKKINENLFAPPPRKAPRKPESN